MADIIERIPPHNDEAERAALGAALISKDALFEVTQGLKANDFYSEAHKEIFEVITDLHRKNEPVDNLTVSDELKKRNVLEMVGGRAYIASLSMSVPSAANAVQYTKIVSEKAMLRRLITAADGIIDRSYTEKNDVGEILDYSEQAIFAIAQQKQSSDFSPLKDVLMDDLDMIDKASQMTEGITGVASGFTDLDAKTSGFQRSDLVIIAARPAMGKTAFALNVAMQSALKANSTALIFSMEMSKEQLGQRLLSMESRVEMQKLKTGQLERVDWEHISMAVDRLSKAKIFIDDTPGISVMEMKNKCRRLKQEHGLDMVLIDYLQLMSLEGRTESRQQEVTALSRYLKLLARELDCPVLVLSQLSRAPEQRTDHRPMLSDLRESGSIEQDADIVIFLYRDEYYNKEESEKPGICEVILAKHRSGSTGTVELTWIDRCTRFCDISKAGR